MTQVSELPASEPPELPQPVTADKIKATPPSRCTSRSVVTDRARRSLKSGHYRISWRGPTERGSCRARRWQGEGPGLQPGPSGHRGDRATVRAAHHRV